MHPATSRSPKTPARTRAVAPPGPAPDYAGQSKSERPAGWRRESSRRRWQTGPQSTAAAAAAAAAAGWSSCTSPRTLSRHAVLFPAWRDRLARASKPARSIAPNSTLQPPGPLPGVGKMTIRADRTACEKTQTSHQRDAHKGPKPPFAQQVSLIQFHCGECYLVQTLLRATARHEEAGDSASQDNGHVRRADERDEDARKDLVVPCCTIDEALHERSHVGPS